MARAEMEPRSTPALLPRKGPQGITAAAGLLPLGSQHPSSHEALQEAAVKPPQAHICSLA